MKAFLSHIHTALSKALNYPIPYWFTPFGIVLIAVTILAMNYGLNWKLNTESWPFWLWAMDKLITVGTIVGAALIAQHIFNKNARKRENRERRLLKIDECLILAEELIDPIGNFLRSNDQNLEKHYIALIKQLLRLKVYDTIYFDNKTITNKLLTTVENLETSYRNYLTTTNDDPPKDLKHLENSKNLNETTSGMIGLLNAELQELHKEIENEH